MPEPKNDNAPSTLNGTGTHRGGADQRRGDRLRDCAAIIGASVVVTLLLRPFQNTPLIDDWCWAWPVDHLLKTGKIASLEYGGNHAIFTQVFWGALFCLPGGFSFAALRVSTWVLAMIGLCLVYLTLRDQNVSRRDSLIAVAILGFNPMFFVLEYSFMTDVPFVTFMLGTVFAFQRAVQRQSNCWLALAVLIAVGVGGIRSVGVVLPIAMLLVLMLHAGRWGRNPLRLFASLVPLAAIFLMFRWREQISQSFADLSSMDTAAETARQNLLAYSIPLLPKSMLATIGTLTVTLGPALLPLALAWAGRCRWTIAAGALGLLVVVWLWLPGRFHCLPSGSTWQWNEVGGLHLPNRTPHTPPGWLDAILTVVSMLSASVATAAAMKSGKSVLRAISGWMMLGLCGLIAILWLFYDRYAVPLIPLAMFLLLRPQPIPRPRLAIAGVALLAAISLIGLRDNLITDAAKRQAFEMLRARGIAIPDIDAGYSYNGWLQYGHPENVRHNTKGEPEIPGLNTDAPSRFQVSFRPMPAANVIGTVPYRRWIGPSGAIYLLEYPSIPWQRNPDARGDGTR